MIPEKTKIQSSLESKDSFWETWHHLPYQFNTGLARWTIINRLHSLTMQSEHALLFYKREVEFDEKEGTFSVKTYRRYGSNASGGIPAVSAQTDGVMTTEGNIKAISKFGVIAMVRVMGLTILAIIALIVSLFTIDWTWANAIGISIWFGTLVIIPMYLWAEMWWDRRALIRDIYKVLDYENNE